MELKDIRGRLDKIDSEILQLFLRRMELAKGVAALKSQDESPIRCPEREREILNRAVENAGALG